MAGSQKFQPLFKVEYIMAGTNHHMTADLPTLQPVILLLRPQLGENIGMTARAMLNMGLTQLRLVAPKQSWPNEAAISPSAGALPDLVDVEVFDDLASASADLHKIWATTARPREMNIEVQEPQVAMQHMQKILSPQNKVGIMFGREATGMNNDEIAFADYIITAPLNPGFCSLNLAQAVLLMAWEWRKLTQTQSEIQEPSSKELASKQDFQGFFEQLEAELDEAGYYRDLGKKPNMIRNLRNIFERTELTSQEVKTLRGVVASLTRRHEVDKSLRRDKGLSIRKSTEG